MLRIALIPTLLALAACGVDGEPVRPTGAAQVTISSGGVSAATRVGLRQGPVSLSLGLGL
ncbi:hypothetical protein ACFSUD_12415 [Sulfitobacter aestuarii]|uniref:Argininosuccinate lyase n=1 Tax=Sulfitobacter aestuarii TaxID=2161676 RepID=A0ABW5U6M6_9RHOB